MTIISKLLSTPLFTNQHKGKLIHYSAAKLNHHSYRCGLLQHITTMLVAAEKLTTVYSCNTDLLYAGIILHDIGKLYEMTTDESCLCTEYTLEGELLGHIAIGLRVIEHMEGIDVEKKLLLQHMILAHHLLFYNIIQRLKPERKHKNVLALI